MATWCSGIGRTLVALLVLTAPFVTSLCCVDRASCHEVAGADGHDSPRVLPSRECCVGSGRAWAIGELSSSGPMPVAVFVRGEAGATALTLGWSAPTTPTMYAAVPLYLRNCAFLI